MPFSIRPHRRFPVCCPVTAHAGPNEGHDTIWNVSHDGWRFSGDLPLRIGEVCSLTVSLAIDQRVYVSAGIMRWACGEEYGVETLVIDEESQGDLEDYLAGCEDDILWSTRA